MKNHWNSTFSSIRPELIYVLTAVYMVNLNPSCTHYLNHTQRQTAEKPFCHDFQVNSGFTSSFLIFPPNPEKIRRDWNLGNFLLSERECKSATNWKSLKFIRRRSEHVYETISDKNCFHLLFFSFVNCSVKFFDVFAPLPAAQLRKLHRTSPA